MTLLPIPFAYAQHLTVENFVLYGVQESNGITPNYARGIVVGSVVIHISKFVFKKSAQNSIIVTDIFLLQRTRSRSSRLKTRISLSAMNVLSRGLMATIRRWAGRRLWIQRRLRSCWVVRVFIFLDFAFFLKIFVARWRWVGALFCVGGGVRVCYCCC